MCSLCDGGEPLFLDKKQSAKLLSAFERVEDTEDFKNVLACMRYGINPRALRASERNRKRIYGRAKELGYTEIVGYGGSGCVCTFTESNNHCGCDGAPHVGRYTTLSREWKEFSTSEWMPTEESVRSRIAEANHR